MTDMSPDLLARRLNSRSLGLAASNLSHPLCISYRHRTPTRHLSRCSVTMDQSADQWHSIRPWIRRFALSVNQVSSVSATFTLKAALTAKLDPTLESLLEDEQDEAPFPPPDHPASAPDHRAVSDALTQGISVKVNSAPWQRVLLRVDEKSDEAIIIVFGLMPGRQYDVELGITHRQEPLRTLITTDDARKCIHCSSIRGTTHVAHWTLSYSNTAPDQTDPNSNSRCGGNANGTTAMPTITPTSEKATPDSTPPASSPTLSASTAGDIPTSVPAQPATLEDKIQQLNQTLSLLQSERDSLTVSLKTARRDAQKADAATRADIETLKRASDKFASVEHRARQKVLALQEAVKQTLAAASDINTAVTDAEASLPALREQQATVEKECKLTKQQAAQAREERVALERHEKKQIDNLQSELAGLGGKLEKLNGRREKLENTVIPDLEEELRKIEEEIANATGPSPLVADRSDDACHYDPALVGVNNQSGSVSALPGLGGFLDNLQSTSQPDSPPGPIEHPRRRKYLSHPPLTTRHQQPQIQKPVQILRPLHQQHQARPTPIGHKPTTTGGGINSTLSGLAAPFEPSPKRQAQLQNTLGTSLNSSSITSALKAELNPTSNVFPPRMGFTTSSTSTTSVSTPTSHKSTGTSLSNSTPGHSAWSAWNQKPRRSDAE